MRAFHSDAASVWYNQVKCLRTRQTSGWNQLPAALCTSTRNTYWRYESLLNSPANNSLWTLVWIIATHICRGSTTMQNALTVTYEYWMKWILFYRLISRKKIIIFFHFSCYLLPEKFCDCPRNIALPDSGDCSLYSPPACRPLTLSWAVESDLQ